MSWQVNLKSRRRTALTPHSTANSKNEQEDEAQDWTSDRQHLNVTWLSVVPSAETAIFGRKWNFSFQKVSIEWMIL